MHSFMNILIQNNVLSKHKIISYNIQYNILYYITKHYYIIIVVYDIKLSKLLLDFYWL